MQDDSSPARAVPPASPQTETPRTRWMPDWLSRGRSLLVDAAVVGSVAAVVAVTLVEVLSDNIVIEEIGLPQRLIEMGYSEQIAALRLWDAMKTVNEETSENSDLDRQTPLLTASEQLEITEPQTKLSLRGLSQMLRKIVGLPQSRVAGEIVCGDEDCSIEKMALRLRVFHHGRVDRVTPEPFGRIETEADLDRYFYGAARKVLEYVDPIMMAEHYNGNDNDLAEEIALRVVHNGHKEKLRAAALLVQTNGYQGELEAAQEWVARVHDMSRRDEFFWDGIAYVNLAMAKEGAYGEDISPDEITADFERAIERFRFAAAWPHRSRQNKLLHLWWGFALSRLNRHAEAAERYRLAMRIDPTDGIVAANLGYSELMAALGKTDRVVAELFERAAALGPEDYAREVRGDGLAMHNLHKDAVAQYEEATEANPERAPSFYGWGVSLAAQGDHRAALGKFWRAAKLQPDHPYVYHNWGRSLAFIGKDGFALRLYAKAVEVNPGNGGAMANWGESLARLGRHEEAVERFAQASERLRDAPWVFEQWAESLWRLGRRVEALEKYAAAARLSQARSVSAWLWETGRYDQALAQYILTPDDSPAASHSEWGDRLSANGRNEDAAAAYARAVANDPADGQAVIGWGVALVGLGRHEDAIQRFEQALGIDPRNDMAYARWGMSLAALGRHDEAAEKLRRAVEIDPGNGLALGRLGTSLAALARLDEAIEAYKAAVEADPANPHALGKWGQTLVELGRTDEAIEKFAELVAVDPDNPHAHVVWADAIRASAGAGQGRDCDKLRALFPRYRDAASAAGHPEAAAALAAERVACAPGLRADARPR